MKIYNSEVHQLFRILLGFIVITSSVSVFAGPAVAQSDQPEWSVNLFDRTAEWVPVYNQNVNADNFGFAASQLKNERVNLVVTDANGEAGTASFRTDGNLRIQEFAMGTRDDATVEMRTDRGTMNSILASSSPVNAFVNAILNEDITISGLGPVAQAKWVVLNVVADLVRMFGP
jgi:hypothetical protein